MQTNFSIKPNPQIACSVCYGAVVLSKLQLSHKIFTLLLAKSNFRFCFSARNFRFIIFNYSRLIFALNFSSSAGRFQLSRFCFSDSNFQVSVGKFQFLRFSFSSVYCQIPTFRLLLAIPIFTLLLCKFSAETNVYFLIVFICVRRIQDLNATRSIIS